MSEKKKYSCNTCNGSGKLECSSCGGTGWNSGDAELCGSCNNGEITCYICNGIGASNTCLKCKGNANLIKKPQKNCPSCGLEAKWIYKEKKEQEKARLIQQEKNVKALNKYQEFQNSVREGPFHVCEICNGNLLIYVERKLIERKKVMNGKTLFKYGIYYYSHTGVAIKYSTQRSWKKIKQEKWTSKCPNCNQNGIVHKLLKGMHANAIIKTLLKEAPDLINENLL